MYQHGSSAGLVSLCVCALSALVLSAPALDAAGPAGGEPTLQDVELLRAWLEEQSAGDGDLYDAEKRGRMFVGKREGLDQDDLLDEDKRARMFVGKRARMFVGKKSADDWESGEWDDEKRARMFVGKRTSYQPRQARRLFIGKRGGYDMEDMYDEDKRARMFVGKRGRMFVGKKSADDWDFNDLDEEKRARMFVGKRRLFVGRRSEEDDKRGRMFVGRRSDGGNMVDDKRARIFVGKRSAEVVSDDDVTIQDGSASS